LNRPHGLALSRDESMLYVADTGNNRVVGIPIRRPAAAGIAAEPSVLPLIVSAELLPSAFMPDRAGLLFAYRLSVPATVQVLVLPQGSNHPLWTAGPFPAGTFGAGAGANSLPWDGRDDRAQIVAPGRYLAIIAASSGSMSEHRILSLTALESPEIVAGRLGGGAGGAGSPAGGSSAVAAKPGAGAVSAGSAPAATSGGAHDNGWHEGNNPNGFTIDHPDKSQGNGNNHH
jgi:hypothetical protein